MNGRKQARRRPGLAEADGSPPRRDDLLAASAAASRLLLQAPDVTKAIPDVLRLIGAAAGVDRVDLMLSQPGSSGEPRFVVAAEWVTDGIVPRSGDPSTEHCDERDFPELSAELRAGRSVCINDGTVVGPAGERGFRLDVGTKSSAIVPIFVDGDFVGIVGFDHCRQHRPMGAAELYALETAAGLIGAALHREILVDAVNRERQRAAEAQVAELVKRDAAILGSLERLTGEPELGSFLTGHMLEQSTSQLDAACATVIVRDDRQAEWRIVAHVRHGHAEAPPYSASIALGSADPFARECAAEDFAQKWHPVWFDLAADISIAWPGMVEHHRSEGHASLVVMPLVFGQSTVGYMTLGFEKLAPPNSMRTELLIALAQGATIAIELTRLADSARDAAVLIERNRIGQEIHDGLAQAFTGILMQLGAAEALNGAPQGPLSVVLSRIRDLAREGLAEARRSVLALHPAQTRRNGLQHALRRLAERSTVPGQVTCTFDGGGQAIALAPEYEHEIFRIGQEAVSNAVRHARPRNVRISMRDGPTDWVLAVTDDGCGMKESPELCAQQGFGLSSMQERAAAIGGALHIETREGIGTCVSVRLPRQQT